MTGTCGAIFLLVNDPVERHRRPHGGIRLQAVRASGRSVPRRGSIIAPTSARRIAAAKPSTSTISPNFNVNQIVVGVGERRWSSRPLIAPVHRARRIGRRDKLRRHIARRAKGRVIEGCQILLHRPARRLGDQPSSSIPSPGSSAACWRRPQSGCASTANPSPPTSPAAMHASTTRSKTWRKMSLSRKRSLRARENAEWSGIVSSMLKPQNQRYAKLT